MPMSGGGPKPCRASGAAAYGRPGSAASAGPAPGTINARARQTARRNRTRPARTGTKEVDRPAVTSDMPLYARWTRADQHPPGRVDVTPLHGLDRSAETTVLGDRCRQGRTKSSFMRDRRCAYGPSPLLILSRFPHAITSPGRLRRLSCSCVVRVRVRVFRVFRVFRVGSLGSVGPVGSVGSVGCYFTAERLARPRRSIGVVGGRSTGLPPQSAKRSSARIPNAVRGSPVVV
jgi:hypothetical protein